MAIFQRYDGAGSPALTEAVSESSSCGGTVGSAVRRRKIIDRDALRFNRLTRSSDQLDPGDHRVVGTQCILPLVTSVAIGFGGYDRRRHIQHDLGPHAQFDLTGKSLLRGIRFTQLQRVPHSQISPLLKSSARQLTVELIVRNVMCIRSKSSLLKRINGIPGHTDIPLQIPPRDIVPHPALRLQNRTVRQIAQRNDIHVILPFLLVILQQIGTILRHPGFQSFVLGIPRISIVRLLSAGAERRQTEKEYRRQPTSHTIHCFLIYEPNQSYKKRRSDSAPE